MEQPKVYRYDTVDSTNTVCKTLAQEGAPDGTAIIAARQTAGRGRMGRGFESPEGLGLYLSMLWRPVASPEGLLPLTAMASASAALAIRRITGADVRIKWPNDLALHGKKLAGILTEVTLSGSGVDHVVIGLGVNLRQRPEDFSPEFQDFLSKCLDKVPDQRGDAHTLLQHPFIQTACTPQEFAPAIEEARKFKDRPLVL